MLTEKIKADLEAAMKAQDKDRTSCLRMVVSAIKYKQVALHQDLDDQEVVKVLRSQVKQVTESLESYTKGGRTDLVEAEKKNLDILKSYLPQELDEEGIRNIVKEIIAETGATKKDFGKVMKLVMTKLAGQADGKIVNSIVNSLLQ
ncbi:MAG TPA: GatB/YqeY domain-containing protein [Deltaproteobacteria bacterium]|mgnify:CR=1 FL=1|nr:GatB/YqeY domain-containing protein [Deltaproteobacteria bacterium]HPR54043.1 GatB/YqeY domain-containing protein [Deltaproteobacteria bacterium]HXK46823.1 GatB/YqeY domain-containing protein [Deltaproteobacteria bacterium]